MFNALLPNFPLRCFQRISKGRALRTNKKDFSTSKNIAVITAFIDFEINLDISNFIYDTLLILLYVSKIWEALSKIVSGEAEVFKARNVKVKKIKCYCLRKWTSEILNCFKRGWVNKDSLLILVSDRFR